MSDGTQLEEYLLHSDHVNCVLYSPTQPHILSAADNGIIKVCTHRLGYCITKKFCDKTFLRILRI